MKKRRTLALLLAAALQTSLLVLPAGAYYLCDDGYSIYENQETRQFWEANRQRLDARDLLFDIEHFEQVSFFQVYHQFLFE